MTRFFLEMAGGADERRRVPIGSALASPRAGKNGGRIHAYSLMRTLKVDDVVLHIRVERGNTRLVGASRVAGACEEVEFRPGVAGYRVPLTGYIELKRALSRDLLLRDESTRPVLERLLRELPEGSEYRPLFYNRDLMLGQGRYLSRLHPDVVTAWEVVHQRVGRAALPYVDLLEQGAATSPR